MRKKVLLGLVLTITSLSACDINTESASDSNTESSDTVLYDHPFDDELPYFDKNGDNLGKEVDTSWTMDNYSKIIGVSELISLLDTGQPIFLYLYQDTCSHCINFKGAIQTFITESLTEVYSLDQSKEGLLYLEIKALKSLNAEMNALFSGAVTPSIYFLYSLNEGEKLTMPSGRDDPNTFKAFIYPLINISNIYDFTIYSKFETLLEELDEVLIFYDDGSEEASDFYNNNIYPYAKNSDKSTIRVLLDEEDEEYSNFLDYMDDVNGLMLVNEEETISYNYLLEEKDCLSLIESYFA